METSSFAVWRGKRGGFFLEVDFLEGSSFFFFLYWSKAAVTILTGKRIRSR